MTIHAVFFDWGGVIARTEYQAPRQHLAERLGMEYEDIVKIVFDSPSSDRASVGEISAEEHWAQVTKRLRRPASETETIRKEFFAGDVIDREIVDYLRSLRSDYFVGLISNAWSDMRDYITGQKIEDAFEHMVISAEVGVMKPQARIYQIALEQAGVSPNEAGFVDDFYKNIEGCQAVGMHGIHFQNPEQAMNELKQLLA
ncbi:MAG: HAD family phosphatase [Anaerolineales bacterium]|jgi:putative hydrolase of the HAD superfamily